MKKFFIIVFFIVFLCWAALVTAEDKNKGSKETAKKPVLEDLIVWVIVPPDCHTCQPQPVIDSLKSFFPRIQTQFINSNDPSATDTIQQLKITMLPAYIFSKSIEKEPNFEKFQQAVDPFGDKYYMKPSLSGVSYFFNRPLEIGKLDMFVFISAKESLPILKMVEGIVQQKQSSKKFALHLIGKQNPEGGFVSPLGGREVEEGKLFACIDQYLPKDSWEYLSCRMGNSESLFWEDCLESKTARKDKIKNCAKGDEGKRLYSEKIKMSQELQLLYGPLFLLNNVEIFGVTAQSTLSDILSVISQ